MRNLWTGVTLLIGAVPAMAQTAPPATPPAMPAPVKSEPPTPEAPKPLAPTPKAAKPGVPFPSMQPGVGFKPPKPAGLTPTKLEPTPEKPKKPDIDPISGAPSFVAGKSIEHWVGELKSPDPTDRELAVKLLRGFGVDAIRKAGGIRILSPLLDDPDPGVRVNAIITTSMVGYEKPEEAKLVAKKLAYLIEHTVKGSVIRVHAANALAGVGEEAEKAIPALVAASDDPAWETRRAIALALGRAGAVVFKDVAISPDGVISTTTKAVERKPSDQAMRTLANKLLRDPSGAVRAGAGQALVMIGPPRGDAQEYARKARPLIEVVVTRLAIEKEASARVWLQLLAIMYDNNQFDAQLKSITDQVNSGDPVTQGQSLLAIAMLGPKASSSRLAVNKALFDPDPGVAYAAITALLNMGDDGKLSLTELERLEVESKDEVIRRSAKDAAAQVRKLVPGIPVAPVPATVAAPPPMKKK